MTTRKKQTQTKEKTTRNIQNKPGDKSYDILLSNIVAKYHNFTYTQMNDYLVGVGLINNKRVLKDDADFMGILGAMYALHLLGVKPDTEYEDIIRGKKEFDKMMAAIDAFKAVFMQQQPDEELKLFQYPVKAQA